MDLHRPRVLISHELTSYAEPLAILLAERRPCLDVRLIAPADLGAAIAEARGSVVITDRLISAVETHAGGWLLYFPGHENLVVVRGAGGLHRIEMPHFDEVLAAIDGLLVECMAVDLSDCLPAISPQGALAAR